MDGVLVVDPDAPFAPAASKAARRLDVPIYERTDEAVAPLLAAQFDEPPAAPVFVDGDEGLVYLGRTAARELAERADRPGLTTAISEAGEVPEEARGVRPLAEAARDQLATLLAAG